MTVTDTILQLAETVAPVFDGKAPTGQPGPYTILYGGLTLPEDRPLAFATGYAETTWRMMAVSDSRLHVTNLANRITKAIDAQVVDGVPLEVRFASDPLEDTADPSAWRWTATLEIHHHTIRSLHD